MNKPTEAMTPKFRVSFPKVFKAEVNKMSGKEEYSLTAIFPKDSDLSKVTSAIEAAAEEKWGPDKKKWPKPLRNPIRKAEDMAQKDDEGNAIKDENGTFILSPGHEAGGLWVRLKSKQKPGLIDAKRDPIIDETQFYAGCWARATVKAFAYEQAGNKGVSLWIQNIQKLSDGDAIGGGRPKAEDQFEAISDLTDAASNSSSADSIFS